MLLLWGFGRSLRTLADVGVKKLTGHGQHATRSGSNQAILVA